MTYCVGLIGFGAINQDVLLSLEPLLKQLQAKVVVLRQQANEHEGVTICTQLDAFLAHEPTLIIEAASQQAVVQYLPRCLETGATVVVSSVGAFTDADLLDQAHALCRSTGSRVIVPSGAVGGLDYIQSLRDAPDLNLIYESLKPVKAWRQELIAADIDPDSITGPYTMFEGNAAEAARLYPKNLNVAATLALAGPGLDKTIVRVIVDPALERNTHRIHAQSQFGKMSMEIRNFPSLTNPKSSWIVAQSIASVVKREFAVFQIR